MRQNQIIQQMQQPMRQQASVPSPLQIAMQQSPMSEYSPMDTMSPNGMMYPGMESPMPQQKPKKKKQANPKSSSPRPTSAYKMPRQNSAGSVSSRHSSNTSVASHPNDFRTGQMHANFKTGRVTPVDKRESIPTAERYRQNQYSTGSLDYDSYNLKDWRQMKSRDGNMILPAGLGHTETPEFKVKVIHNHLSL
jgi:hypothetical protein